jgi:epoxyqueuosine reductase QueG
MGICVTKEFGNCFRPAAVATDMPLVTDKPVDFGLQEFGEHAASAPNHAPSAPLLRGRERARTMADVEYQENIQPAHLSEAMQYRTLDRNLIA